LKLTNRRKLSKILLFMDIAELFQGPQVSGSAKFYLPGIGELIKRQEISGVWLPRVPVASQISRYPVLESK
jgi:hypothetical protein